MSNNNMLKNKTLSSIMSSAKKNGELLGKGMGILDGLKSDKGIDRVKAIGKIIAKIYGANA